VIINGYVKQKLGILPGSGADFFYGYGEQTGLMWQQFRAAITAFGVNSDQHDVVVASARATFETLQQWCEKE
jgi:heme oxygenase